MNRRTWPLRKIGLPRRVALALLSLLPLWGTYPAGASAAPATAPAALQPYTEKVPGTDVTFSMVPIPGGTFRMGSPAGEKGRKEDEGPQVEVEVEPFYMGRHEVTQAEFWEFAANYTRLARRSANPVPKDKWADAVTYPTPTYELEVGPILEGLGGRGGKFPMVHVSHLDARQYTKWLSKKTGRFYRLPTEAEWEYACRAGTTTAYHFGDDARKLGEYAWYSRNSEQGEERFPFRYHHVGGKNPNAWGLYDMHGNAAEWCIDQYEKGWYGKLAGRKVKASDVIRWPDADARTPYPRVLRGGSYESDEEQCRSAARLASDRQMDKYNVHDLPDSPHWMTNGFFIGMRVVSPVKEPPEAEKLRYWEADNQLNRTALRRYREIREIITTPP